MPFIRSEDLEDIVKTIVSKSWPQATSRGMMNLSSPNPTGLGRVVSGTEGNSESSKRIFVNGTSRWGGGRIVGN